MKTKILLTLCLLFTFCSANAHILMALTPEQGDTLTQIIINVVSFLLGLFINPKKKDKQ